MARPRRRARRQASKRLVPFYRMTFIILMGAVAARLIILGIDALGARTGLPGGELFIPLYIIIAPVFGWQLRGWTAIGSHQRRKEGSEMSKTLYFEGAGWSGADRSKATIGNCRIRTAFHLDPEKKHPRCSCGEPHDGAAAVYLEIICGTIGKENRKLGLEPTYYGWIDHLHYVTDDDRNDDCNRHILPFERRTRIDYTLESILKFVNDLGASFDAVAVCPDFGGYRVFRDGYSPKGTERLNYGDEFQCDPDMAARREAVYRHVYELEKAEGSRYPNFSLWVDQDDPGMLHLLRHFSGTSKTAHITHWTIRTDTGSTVEDWMATATVTPLGRYGC